jgi:acyl-CoA dehydrogenase
MELLSARLGDVLSHLYLASACLWRYEVEADPKMRPIARAAIRVQLDLAAATLRDLYANLPSRLLRIAAPLLLRGTRHLAPLRDRDLIAQADALREDRALVRRLCPDVGMPSAGGLHDLMQAIQLADDVGDELPELNKVLRRTSSLEQTARGSRDPASALAYLLAADRVIQVDDFAP